MKQKIDFLLIVLAMAVIVLLTKEIQANPESNGTMNAIEYFGDK